MNLQQIMEILNIAMAVNGFEEREAPLGLPTVFVYISGHVAKLEVQVHETGWCAEGAGDYDKHFIFLFNKPLNQNYMNEYRTYMANITPFISMGEGVMQRV